MTATTVELPGMSAKPAPRGKYDDYHDAMFWLARFVRSRQYRFAKTLANNPHYYLSRYSTGWGEKQRFPPDPEFDKCAELVLRYGYKRKWVNGKHYPEVHLNGYMYWLDRFNTRGGTRPEWICLNRKREQYWSAYDAGDLSENYDGLKTDEMRYRRVFEAIGLGPDDWSAKEPLFDIGCGTGFLLDRLDIPENSYVGIDPSIYMLYTTHGKWSRHQFVQTKFEHYYPVDVRHKTLLALFGGAAYMRERDISKLPRIMAPGGRWALMTVPMKACRHCLGGITEANYANNSKLFDAICSERIEMSEFDWLYVS